MKQRGVPHKIVMPKDYSKDTGCIILNTDFHYVEGERKTQYLLYQIVHANQTQGPRRHSENETLKETINVARGPADHFKITERQEIHIKVKELNNKIYSVNLETWAVKELVDAGSP